MLEKIDCVFCINPDMQRRRGGAGDISSLLRMLPMHVLRTTVQTVHVTHCHRQCCFTKQRTNSGYTSSKNVFVSQNPTEVQSAAITITTYIRIIYHTEDNILKPLINFNGWYCIKAAIRESSGRHYVDRDFTKNHHAVYSTNETLQLTQRH